jgi:hypothetical protein
MDVPNISGNCGTIGLNRLKATVRMIAFHPSAVVKHTAAEQVSGEVVVAVNAVTAASRSKSLEWAFVACVPY